MYKRQVVGSVVVGSIVVVADPDNNIAGGTAAAVATRRMAKMLHPITFDFFDIPIMINIAIEMMTINLQLF